MSNGKFKTRTIFRSTLVLSSVLLISRVLGYVRDVIVAARLGTGVMNDTFIAAFKIANLFRSIFGEGAFNSAFVPLFSRLLHSRGPKYARAVCCRTQAVLALALLVVSLLVIMGMKFVIELTTPGFKVDSDAFVLTVRLGRITFPYLFFVSLAAFYGAIMSGYGSFVPYAFTSIILNITLIVSTFFMNHTATPAHSLAYGVVVAGMLEITLMLFCIYKRGILLPLVMPKVTKYVRLIIKRMLPSILSSGMMQINVWVNMLFLSFIPGGMSYIYFADRLIQLPLALISTAMSITLLPALSAAIKDVNKNASLILINKSIKFIAFFAVPSAVGLFLLSTSIVSILFMRGNFSSESVVNTASALQAFAIGLPAYMLLKPLNIVFYAYEDTKNPMIVAVFSMFINVMLSIFLLKKYGHTGIACSSAVSAWINAVILVVFLCKLKRLYLPKSLLMDLGKFVTAAFGMGVALYYVTKLYNSFNILIPFIILIISTIVLYLGLCSLLRFNLGQLLRSVLRNEDTSI